MSACLVTHVPRDERCSQDWNQCTVERCDPSSGCISEPLTGDFDFDPHDCYKDQCLNGYASQTPDDSEVPPQSPNNAARCEKQVCSGGGVMTVSDEYATPPAEPHNCNVEGCGRFGVMYAFDPADKPLQDSPNDCLRQECGSYLAGEGYWIGFVQTVPDPTENTAAPARRKDRLVLG